MTHTQSISQVIEFSYTLTFNILLKSLIRNWLCSLANHYLRLPQMKRTWWNTIKSEFFYTQLLLKEHYYLLVKSKGHIMWSCPLCGEDYGSGLLSLCWAHWSRNCQVHSIVLGAVETHKYGITCAFTSLHLPTLIGSVMLSIPTDLFQAVSFVPPAPQAVSYNKTRARFSLCPHPLLYSIFRKSQRKTKSNLQRQPEPHIRLTYGSVCL